MSKMSKKDLVFKMGLSRWILKSPKKGKVHLEIAKCFQGNLETHQRTFLHIQEDAKCI